MTTSKSPSLAIWGCSEVTKDLTNSGHDHLTATMWLTRKEPFQNGFMSMRQNGAEMSGSCSPTHKRKSNKSSIYITPRFTRFIIYICDSQAKLSAKIRELSPYTLFKRLNGQFRTVLLTLIARRGRMSCILVEATWLQKVNVSVLHNDTKV